MLNKKYYFTILASCMLLHTTAQAQSTYQTDLRDVGGIEPLAIIDEGMPPHIGFNRTASEIMFDRQNHVTDKNVQQLKLRQKLQNGEKILKDKKFTLGGRFIGHSMYEKTNTDGKFPILSRLPPSHTSNDEDNVNLVSDASFNMTATLPMVTAFGQGEYTESAYKGQDRFSWRKYWVTVGDLDKFPAYLTVGKKSINFGDMSSYSPFTHSHNAHYFWAQSKEPVVEVGYVDNGWHASGTLIKNDRGLRVLNSPSNDGNYENFALNATKRIALSGDKSVKLGAGYVRGTIYDSSVAHHPPSAGADDRDWNGAYNLHAVYNTDKYDLMAEFTRTIDEWPATDSEVHALTLQGRYRDYLWHFPTTYSLMWSEGVQGDRDDEWHKMTQTVLGIESKLLPNMSLGLEYLLNTGFVPLIMPKITADDGVVSHTAIAGVKVTF